MRRMIGLIIRISMYVSLRFGSYWWVIERDWHDLVEYQMNRVLGRSKD